MKREYRGRFRKVYRTVREENSTQRGFAIKKLKRRMSTNIFSNPTSVVLVFPGNRVYHVRNLTSAVRKYRKNSSHHTLLTTMNIKTVGVKMFVISQKVYFSVNKKILKLRFFRHVIDRIHGEQFNVSRKIIPVHQLPCFQP